DSAAMALVGEFDDFDDLAEEEEVESAAPDRATSDATAASNGHAAASGESRRGRRRRRRRRGDKSQDSIQQEWIDQTVPADDGAAKQAPADQQPAPTDQNQPPLAVQGSKRSRRRRGRRKRRGGEQPVVNESNGLPLPGQGMATGESMSAPFD